MHAPPPADVGGGTSPVDASELTRVVAEIRAGGERTAAPAPGAGEAAAADTEHDALEGIEKIAMGDPAAIQALEDLTEDDLADLCELGFGMVADLRNEKHWELSTKSARRLGRCLKRTLDRHGWQWAAKWMPDVLTALFVGFEISKRVALSKQLAAAKKPETVAA